MKYLLEQPVKGAIGPEKYKAIIQWRNGILITDEPKTLGGGDIGPDPFTLLLSSLVSCTLSTLRMYIEQKELIVPEISIEANMFYSIDQNGLAIRIERKISMDDLENPELREKLIKISENCPISKILKGTVKISTAFK